jgi:hypothetical protein
MASEEQRDWLTEQTLRVVAQLKQIDQAGPPADKARLLAVVLSWVVALAKDARLRAAKASQDNLVADIEALQIRLEEDAKALGRDGFSVANWPRIRADIERVWIEHCGLIGYEERLGQVSLVDELSTSMDDVFSAIGRGAGSVARKVGATAGNLVFGFTTGAGIITTVLMAAGLWYYFKGKK